MQGAQVQTLVRELRSRVLCNTAKKKGNDIAACLQGDLQKAPSFI